MVFVEKTTDIQTVLIGRICKRLNIRNSGWCLKFLKLSSVFWCVGGLPLNPGRFGPGSFRPESFRPESFRPILGVGRFGLGRWVVSAKFLGESIRPGIGPESFRPRFMEIFR